MNKLIHLKLFLIGVLASFIISGCKKTEGTHKNGGQSHRISVAAAANLRDVLEELKKVYIKENSGRTIDITFASSGLMVQQILNGAPFDLFLSADASFPEILKKKNKASGNPETYAYGKIALWSATSDVSQGLKLVLNPDVKKIAIANPELAPYGKNAVGALKKSGLYESIEHKIVWAENIGQAAQFASTGNADIAFVALSNAMSQEMMNKGKYYVLSEKEAFPIPQSGTVLKGKNTAGAGDFLHFIRSEKAVPIWKKYGYQPEIKR
ncbi:molybdate ABC transporter substrate-binding protein [Chryseobacterium sp. SSA4.19]|uniref:molybdate ABC transporter substrate-binding protein n=1 Tax=Chryseobacterium sp. SSA4.19 TaxID=2919915 RepID=UPI001F4D4A3A|nr:molybdate ABC transporter substrate-binding protein [Chryseobacterium sp. SSA4.19]MCJ8154545.1 molybdate ABC transporter substrate-binding protein [Chryseobacterium sp. SSA4.19]